MVQARGLAKRQAIMAAAADLFDERGAANASLADVIDRAGGTRGGFIYHFPSREALVAALAQEADIRIAETMMQGFGSATSALEGLIRASFLVAELIQRHTVTRVGLQLLYGSPSGGLGTTGDTDTRLVASDSAVVRAMAEGDLRDDLDPEQISYTIAMSLRGCFLNSVAAGVDPCAGLAGIWPVLLRGIVTDGLVDYVDQMVTRLAHKHSRVGI